MHINRELLIQVLVIKVGMLFAVSSALLRFHRHRHNI